jgi:hypothetical protein
LSVQFNGLVVRVRAKYLKKNCFFFTNSQREFVPIWGSPLANPKFLAPIEADCAALADWELDLRLWKGCLAVKNQQHVFSGGAMERKAGGEVRRNPGWRFGINVEKLNVLQMEKKIGRK